MWDVANVIFLVMCECTGSVSGKTDVLVVGSVLEDGRPVNESIIQNNPSNKIISKYLKNMKKIFEKKILLKKDIKKNYILNLKNLAFKKTKKGINANKYKNIIGKKLKIDMKKNSVIKMINLYD